VDLVIYPECSTYVHASILPKLLLPIRSNGLLRHVATQQASLEIIKYSKLTLPSGKEMVVLEAWGEHCKLILLLL